MTDSVKQKAKDFDNMRRKALAAEEEEIKEEKTKIYLEKHTITDKKQKEKVLQKLCASVKDKNFLRDYEVGCENGEDDWKREYTVYSYLQEGDIVWYTEGSRSCLVVVLLLDPIGEKKLFVNFFGKEAAELSDAIEAAYKTQESLKGTKEKNTIEIALDSFFQRIK